MINILSIIVNVVFVIILNLNIYTDRANMPDGQIREWQRSPLTRVDLSGMSYLYYLQLLAVAVSVITAVMILSENRAETLRKIWIISSIVSILMFAAIIIITANSHVKYA